MIIMTKQGLSYLYISITVLLWGSTAAVAKLLLENLDNIQLLLYISLFATISLFIIIIIFFQKKISQIKNFKLNDYIYFAGMGFLGVFLYHIFLFGALSVSPAQEAFIINYTWPIWVVIFAIIVLRQKINLYKSTGIVLGFIGVYIVITKGDFLGFSSVNIQGVLFALSGAISYGLFSVLGKKKNYDAYISMMFFFVFTFIYSLISSVLFSSIPIINLYELIGIIWMGIFALGLAFVFWFLALHHGDVIEMSNIVFLTPFISLFYINLLLDEEILVYSIIGLFIIILGILLNNSWRNK
jgi:drug/metabolite transporter (DMT)-like permease